MFHGLFEQISDIFVTALNQGLIQFELKANIRIIVYMTQKTLGECLSCFLSFRNSQSASTVKLPLSANP